MSVAALFDIHGNLPALDAVLADVRAAGVDRIVVGGDVVPGPMSREALERLLALSIPVQFIRGNCELATLAQMRAATPDAATYWGTASGRPLPEPYLSRMRLAAEQVRDHEALLASWPRTLRLEIDGIGSVLFCHSTPRDEAEIFTRLTPPERLAPIFDPLGADVVVCGHTHMQFDRRVGSTRIVNSGSVGAPIGRTGAFWTLLGPDVELRQTAYDVAATAAQFRGIAYPDADEAARDLVSPPSEAEMVEIYENAALK